MITRTEAENTVRAICEALFSSTMATNDGRVMQDTRSLSKLGRIQVVYPAGCAAGTGDVTLNSVQKINQSGGNLSDGVLTLMKLDRNAAVQTLVARLRVALPELVVTPATQAALVSTIKRQLDAVVAQRTVGSSVITEIKMTTCGATIENETVIIHSPNTHKDGWRLHPILWFNPSPTVWSAYCWFHQNF